MLTPGYIDTEAESARLRAASIDHEGKRLLITNFHGTEQERDLSEPPNCRGFGRIRHFRRTTGPGWPPNPLPIDPACRALGMPQTDELRAQAFQNAACNWRCWYCYVPFNLLAALHKHSAWLSPATLIALYLDQPDPPPMIDLTGGQPDLIPEWIPWMMAELRSRGLEKKVYLWSNDNLSTDYLWRFLSEADCELLAMNPNYGRVGCFKGYNAESFSFNTRAEPALFDRQFQLMSRLLALKLDVYAYATFTTPSRAGVQDDMCRFVDGLQEIDGNLPLRTVPLEIRQFTPVQQRLGDAEREALVHQRAAVEAWQQELERRYSSVERARCIVDVPLRARESL